MTEFHIQFVEDREDETVVAATRAEAFQTAQRKFDATPRYVSEVEPDE